MHTFRKKNLNKKRSKKSFPKKNKNLMKTNKYRQSKKMSGGVDTVQVVDKFKLLGLEDSTFCYEGSNKVVESGIDNFGKIKKTVSKCFAPYDMDPKFSEQIFIKFLISLMSKPDLMEEFQKVVNKVLLEDRSGDTTSYRINLVTNFESDKKYIDTWLPEIVHNLKEYDDLREYLPFDIFMNCLVSYTPEVKQIYKSKLNKSLLIEEKERKLIQEFIKLSETIEKKRKQWNEFKDNLKKNLNKISALYRPKNRPKNQSRILLKIS